MTVAETLKKLITAENYLTERMKVSDEFINLIRDMLPYDYEYIKEKEEDYQKQIILLKEIFESNKDLNE
jgi:hypothetical protein